MLLICDVSLRKWNKMFLSICMIRGWNYLLYKGIKLFKQSLCDVNGRDGIFLCLEFKKCQRLHTRRQCQGYHRDVSFTTFSNTNCDDLNENSFGQWPRLKFRSFLSSSLAPNVVLYGFISTWNCCFQNKSFWLLKTVWKHSNMCQLFENDEKTKVINSSKTRYKIVKHTNCDDSKKFSFSHSSLTLFSQIQTKQLEN